MNKYNQTMLYCGMRFTLDINVNINPAQQNEAIKLLKELKIINTKIMATLEQFESALNRIDVATTNIAEQLRDLKEQLTNAGLSAEVEAQVLARLETAATQLEAVGTSVENPVPDPEEPTE